MGAHGGGGRRGLPRPVRRVALYYPWIYVRSGVERVILEIVRRSRHRYTVFTNHVNYAQTYPEFSQLANLVVLEQVPVARTFGAVLRAARTIVAQRLDLAGFDALLVSSEGLGDLITFRNHSKPVFCFCHTPVRPVYDPVYRATWLANHRGGRIPLTLYSFAYHWVTRLAWRHYRRVFANSREVAGRIAAGSLCASDKVEVLHPGVDVDAIRPCFEYDHYFLYAGRMKWTKNVELAIDAFSTFQAQGEAGKWRLVIAGGVDASSREYVAALRRRAGVDGAITFVENPSDADLAGLYARCRALIFPSLNEDWGIVPLEAMAHGKPVLAVNRGGPMESVVDGETGYLLEPTAAAFASAMQRLAAHPALGERLGQCAAERVRRFSWEEFVRRLDDYIEEIA